MILVYESTHKGLQVCVSAHARSILTYVCFSNKMRVPTRLFTRREHKSFLISLHLTPMHAEKYDSLQSYTPFFLPKIYFAIAKRRAGGREGGILRLSSRKSFAFRRWAADFHARNFSNAEQTFSSSRRIKKKTILLRGFSGPTFLYEFSLFSYFFFPPFNISQQNYFPLLSSKVLFTSRWSVYDAMERDKGRKWIVHEWN